METKKKIDILKASNALTCASTTRNRLLRDNRFFALRLQSWLVFVEDLGESQDEKKEHQQLTLF